MATTKPRITVTLEPATHEVLKRMSDLGGESMSSLVSSLVELAAPTLKRAADIIEAAKGADEKALQAFVGALGEAEARLVPFLASAQALEAEVSEIVLGIQEGLNAPPGGPAEAPQGTRAPLGSTGPEEPSQRRQEQVDPRVCNHGGQIGTDEEHEGGRG